MKEFGKILAVNLLCTLTCCIAFWLLLITKKISKAEFDLVTTNTTYVKDTSTHRAIVNNSYANTYPVKVIETAQPLIVDSASIFKYYFNKYVYERTFDDSLITWKMIDTISENRFSPFSKYQYTLKRPITTTINNFEKPKKFGMYAGLRYTFAKDEFKTNAVIGINTKSNFSMDFSYNPAHKEFQVGTYYKLFGR